MSDRDPAAARWAVIQAARAVGVATALVGLLHQAGRIGLLDGVPAWFGYVLIGIGLVEVFYLPVVLAHQWRTPPQ